MSVKLNLIKELLQESIDKIDAGTSNKTDEELDEIVKFLTKMNRGVKRISKYQACKDILHCSQSTFNLYLGLGIIPPGKKEVGFHELSWSEEDFDVAIKYRNQHKE